MDQFQFSGFTASNTMYCTVDGTDIIQIDYMNGRQVIGKTMEAYQDLEETTSQYYEKLVELGAIIPPKSQEEMMAEMQKSMLEMSGIIAGLSNELKELKNREPGKCTCHSGEDVPQREPKRSGTKGAGGDQRDSGQP